MHWQIENKSSKELRVYLDTNIIFGFFKSMLQSMFKRRRLKRVWRLYFLAKNKKLQVFISTFTLIEVKESIRKWLNEENKNLSEDQVKGLMNYFEEIFDFKILESIELKNILEYSDLDAKDSIQVEIARANKLILVTEDKKLREVGTEFYQGILSFDELMKLL
jgi:predicted nucleic acid-binding protein